MPTFAQLQADPTLLPPDLRSPILHPDGTVTILWEGEAEGELVTIVEWIEGPVPLKRIPDTNLWGADLPAPPIPATVCTRIPIGQGGRALPSPRHNPLLLGPEALQPVGEPSQSARLDADLTLPLGDEARRVRAFLPPGATAADPLPVLLTLDAQFFIDRTPAFPRTTDRLAEEGQIPPVLLVALDNHLTDRAGEFQAGSRANHAARTWVWEQVLPWIRERYPNAGPVYLLGFSMGGSFASQLLLGRPDLFAGGALLSPAHGPGRENVWAMLPESQGGQRVYLCHGDFGNWEQLTRPATVELTERLTSLGHTVRFEEFPGFGHSLDAMERCFGPALCWLLGEEA